MAGLFAGQAGAALVPRLQQEQGFRACMPEARDPLQVLHTLDTDTLSTIYPFVPASPRTAGGILFGVDEQTHQLVELDLFDHRVCQNANVGIFAPSGGGKTFFTKVLARRYLLLTDTTDVIIIDRKHEYRALCETMGGQFLRVAAVVAAPHQSVRPATARSERRRIGPAGPHPAGPGAPRRAAGRARPAAVAHRTRCTRSHDQGGLSGGRHH